MFVAFADSGAGSTVLNLASSINGKLYHGFSTSELDKDSIKANDGADIGTIAVVDAVEVDMEVATAQTLGYYGFYTTGNSQATVTISTNSRLSTTAGTDLWEVPFTLSFAETVSDGTRAANFTTNTASMGTAAMGAIKTGGATAPSTQLLLTAVGSGLGVKAYRLDATFIGATNEDLPEGSYTGTITAIVAAP